MTNAKRIVGAVVGVVFGCVLFFFAAIGAGAGHGSYFLFNIIAAPVSLIPGIGLFAAPFWWGAVGWLVNSDGNPLAKRLMIIHTAGIALALWLDNPLNAGNARHLRDAEGDIAGWLLSGLSIHAVGFVVAWVLALRSARR